MRKQEMKAERNCPARIHASGINFRREMFYLFIAQADSFEKGSSLSINPKMIFRRMFSGGGSFLRRSRNESINFLADLFSSWPSSRDQPSNLSLSTADDYNLSGDSRTTPPLTFKMTFDTREPPVSSNRWGRIFSIELLRIKEVDDNKYSNT